VLNRFSDDVKNRPLRDLANHPTIGKPVLLFVACASRNAGVQVPTSRVVQAGRSRACESANRGEPFRKTGAISSGYARPILPCGPEQCDPDPNGVMMPIKASANLGAPLAGTFFIFALVVGTLQISGFVR
jgi:hypothetical protein